MRMVQRAVQGGGTTHFASCHKNGLMGGKLGMCMTKTPPESFRLDFGISSNRE